VALTATLYNFDTELADIDRGVYQTLALRLARHPSETPEFMLTRLLAYCLEYTEGIEFTDGVSAGDDPAVVVRDMTGRITAWIEIGMPDAARLHRGSKLAGRAAVYTHRNVAKVLEGLNGKQVHRAAEIPVYELGKGFIEEVAAVLQRRDKISVSVTERQLYLDISGRTFNTTVVEHRFS
jgi:uncharacterized protein YaeQ